MINGHKWFTSGALDPRCKFAIFMGVTDPDADAHRRQSMILVPMDTPGVTVVRGLPVFGHSEGGGHGETLLENVRVPEGEPARRGGRRLRDRAGPARPRPHPPLHARDRARRTRARPDVHARADARRVRQAARRPGRRARAHRRVAHADRAGAAAHDEGGVDDGHRRQEGRADRDRGDQGGRGPGRHRRDRPRDPAVRRRGRHRRLAARRRCTRTRARCTSSTGPTRCTCARSPAASSASTRTSARRASRQ